MKLRRKRHRFSLFICIIIFYIIFSFSFTLFLRNNKVVNNEKFISFLLNDGDITQVNQGFVIDVINNTVKYLMGIDFTNPVSIVDVGKRIKEIRNDEDDANLKELKSISKYVDDINNDEVMDPMIYIYNTHQLENYDDNNLSIYNITPNVMMASFIFSEKLKKNGIKAIVEDANITSMLELNKWNYSESYKASRLLLLEKVNKYSSIKYYIDLHRDSVSREVTTTVIDNKSYAKIMFVLGLENKNYQNNLDVITKLNKMINDKYPTLSRGIYKKEGIGVDGVYNQDIDKNVMLIEVGGVDNSIEEVFNTLEVLAYTFTTFMENNHE